MLRLKSKPPTSAHGTRVEVAGNERGLDARHLGERPVLAVGGAHHADDGAGLERAVLILLGDLSEMTAAELQAFGVERHDLVGRQGGLDDLGIGFGDDGGDHEGEAVVLAIAARMFSACLSAGPRSM